MAEQWIPAETALRLVSSSADVYADRMTICARANAGLIRARARLLLVDEAKRENVELPTWFWWAKGHEALDQEWTTGDFSTWIDKSVHWRAFGVSFALDGVLELLPIEQRALTAQRLSVVGMNEWISAKLARQFAYDKARFNPSLASTAIIDACQLGYVTARAVLMRRADGARPDNWVAEEREWDVPKWFWDNFTASQSSSQDWERGVFAGKGLGPSGPCWITLTGVFFLAATLDVLLPHSDAPAQSSATTANPVGRPRKEWWDDMWCAVWGQVYRGDLTPKRQADIEKAMLGWVAENGHSVAESVVRPLARKMMAAMASEGENSK